MRKKRPCAYCGSPKAKTRDHIPPKALFARPLPVDLITVPACTRCHADTAEDDEYFAIAVLTTRELGDLPAPESARDRILETIASPERRGLGLRILHSFEDVELKTPSGIIVGRVSAMRVDDARTKRVMQRIIRGLHFNERRFRIDASARIGVRLIQSHQYEATREFVNLKWDAERSAAGGALRYQFAALPEDPTWSLWIVQFYERILILGVVRGAADETEEGA